MRVKDFLKMYKGFGRIEVEINASFTVFNKKHYLVVAEFTIDCEKVYTTRRECYLSEEVIGFDIVNGKLRLMIRGV